jgi:SAM-dependent methyltransferase
MVTAPDRVTAATELMELPCADLRELSSTLEDLAWINRSLGGTRVVIGHIAPLLRSLPAPVRILDVGTGYADIPRAIARWARQRGLPVEIEGLDRHDQILELAARAGADYPEIRLRQGDALALPYPDLEFDVVLASLILHHMEDEEQVRLLRELNRVARRFALVNDLRRGRWPFVVTWTSLRLVSRNRMIHHDGPLSIRRGFVAQELGALARAAGWSRARVTRHAFFRLALAAQKWS